MSPKVEDVLSLFALLSADGSINRLGTGAVDNTEREMCIGVISNPQPFQTLRAQISPETFKWLGGRADQSPKGKICELTIWLFLPNKEERTIYFKYGSESMGPPPEVCRLVMAAIDATDPWYEQFKANMGNRGNVPDPA